MIIVEEIPNIFYVLCLDDAKQTEPREFMEFIRSVDELCDIDKMTLIRHRNFSTMNERYYCICISLIWYTYIPLVGGNVIY